jgi:hypothetical protein
VPERVPETSGKFHGGKARGGELRGVGEADYKRSFGRVR